MVYHMLMTYLKINSFLLQNNTFDPLAAQSQKFHSPQYILLAHNDLHPLGLAQASSGSQPASTASNTVSAGPTDTQAPIASSKSNAGAIAGGVVGGVVGLSVIALVIFYFFLRGGSRWKRRSRAQERVDLDEDDMHAVSPPPGATHEHSSTPISSSRSPYVLVRFNIQI
jgi:hypothetical protein